MKDFLEKYSIPPQFADDEFFIRAKKLYKSKGESIFDFEKYGAFEAHLSEIIKIKEEAKKDAGLCLLTYMIYLAISQEKYSLAEALSKPQIENGEVRDCLSLFALMAFIPDMLKRHKDLGVPEEISRATVKMFENQAEDFKTLNGHFGMSSYISWILSFIKARILRIGRFNFEFTSFGDSYRVFKSKDDIVILADGAEFNASGFVLGTVGYEKETDGRVLSIKETADEYIGTRVSAKGVLNEVSLKKNEYQCVLKKGDAIISVHIPSGGRLNFEEYRHDFEIAAKVARKSFIETRCFYCESWLLDPRIREITGKDGALTFFAGLFERFPCKCSGKGVFEYLYSTHFNGDFDKLPQNTSMQRAILPYLKSGGHIYETCGVFFL